MLRPDMSELTSSKRHGNLGRTLLWVAIALSVLLLGFVTALTIRANPYVSDREANGISKYKFLEACKEQLAEDEQLVSLQGLLQQSGQLQAGQRLSAEIAAEPADLVGSVQEAQGGGWTLNVPANIQVNGEGAPLGQLPFQCAHDKAQNRTTAQLQLPGGV